MNLGGMKNLSTPILLQRASAISFNNPLGQVIDLAQNGLVNSPNLNFHSALPGVFALYWLQTYGVANNANDPVNLYAGRLFTDIRKQLSSLVTTYDAAELLNYLMACDSVFSITEWCYRLYGVLGNYVQENRYQPKAFVRAMGVDYDDIVQHISDFAFYINTIVARSKALRLPKDFVIAQRHMNMSFNIYRDENISKSQFYVYSPKYLYKYDAANNKMVTIDFCPIFKSGGSLMKYSDIVAKIDDLLATIIPDETMNCIAGDLRKVYPESNFWKLNEMDITFKVEPIFDKSILFEIHNANFLDYDSVDDLSITQIVNNTYDVILKFDPTFITSHPGVAMKRILDIDNNNPTAAEIAFGCRLKYTIRNWTWNTSTHKGTFKLGSCSTELLLGAAVIYFNGNNVLTVRDYTQFPNCSGGSINTQSVYGTIGATMQEASDNFFDMNVVRAFNQYPLSFNVNATGNPLYIDGIYGRVDNYTIVEDTVLYKINEATLLDSYSIKVGG